jgi:hypothetical protein
LAPDNGGPRSQCLRTLDMFARHTFLQRTSSNPSEVICKVSEPYGNFWKSPHLSENLGQPLLGEKWLDEKEREKALLIVPTSLCLCTPLGPIFLPFQDGGIHRHKRLRPTLIKLGFVNEYKWSIKPSLRPAWCLKFINRAMRTKRRHGVGQAEQNRTISINIVSLSLPIAVHLICVMARLQSGSMSDRQ